MPRGRMPQVPDDALGELADFFDGKGITLTSKKVKADTLQASQRNFNKDKILSAAANYATSDKAPPIIVSKDNYVIDGHHRWLGALNVGGEIRVLQSSENAKETIEAMLDFPKSFKKNINESSQRMI